jgi:hypothetical protein
MAGKMKRRVWPGKHCGVWSPPVCSLFLLASDNADKDRNESNRTGKFSQNGWWSTQTGNTCGKTLAKPKRSSEGSLCSANEKTLRLKLQDSFD